MPEEQNTQQEQPTQTPQQDGENPYQQAEVQKEVDVKKTENKRKLFKNLKLVLFLFVSVIVIGFGVMQLSSSGGISLNPGGNETTPTENPDNSKIVDNPEDPIEDPVDDGPVVGPDGLVEFLSRDLKVSFKYPPEAEFIELYNQSNIETYEVRISNQEDPINSFEDLKDGYILRILVNKNVTDGNLDRALLDIRRGYIARCPGTANVSNIYDAFVAQTSGREFSVENCNNNYLETMIVKDGVVYQFTRVWRGVLGTEQRYRTEVEDLLGNFAFTNTIKPTPMDTWAKIEYSLSRSRSITFSHPSEMDSKCCNIEGPISENANEVVVLAMPETSDNAGFVGFGVYMDKNPGRLQFENYVADQVNKLQQNYRLVIGREPDPKRSEVNVGGQTGVRYEDLAWWGDIIFVQIPGRSDILVFVASNKNQVGFDPIFTGILATVEF